MHTLFALLISCALLSLSSLCMATPTVVVSTKPIHALTSAIMEGVDKPALLIDGQLSPHDFQLQPSIAHKINHTDLVIWVGPQLESRLSKALLSLTTTKQRLTLIEHALPITLPIDGTHTKHRHSNQLDPHIWLHPLNAIAIAEHISKRLITLDTTHQKNYQENTRKLIKDIKKLDEKIKLAFTNLHNANYVTIHSGLNYFKSHYQLSSAGTLITNDHHQISAKKISAFKKIIRQKKINCIFYDPFTPEKLLKLLLEDTESQAIMIDILGINSKIISYTDILQKLTQSIADCLSQTDRGKANEIP